MFNMDYLAAQAVASPHKSAVSTPSHDFTYAQLTERVGETAEHLATWGIQPGCRVAVLLPNGLDYFVLIHALARLGAVLVSLNTRLTPVELRWQLEQALCHCLIVNRVLAQTADFSPIPVLLFDDPSSWPPPLSPSPVSADLPRAATLVFTSGTTGKPKAAIIPPDHFLWGAMASAYRLGVWPQDRWLLCMPMYHVGGLAIVWRCCLYGITAVLHDHFDAQAVNQAIDEQGVTLVSLVPTMLQRVLQARQERPFPGSLRCILLGGAAAPRQLLAQCQQLGVPVALTYGLTEATSQVTTAVPAEVWHKPGSVGKPLLFSAVKIVGEAGESLRPGQTGEICVTGPTVMMGYYRQPDATEKVLQNGWLHTGDMGYLDAAGDLWVVQRRSDLIVSGGENVYPAEVEEVLRGITAVQEACVVGIPDETWGQKVAAAIVLHPHQTINEAEITAHCREQLAGYKQPRLIHFIPQLPQTASGKIHRQAVSDLLQEVVNVKREA